MSESTYHQIHFAWAEPTLLGHVGPGPAASSLAESDQPALRSWRDRLLPALTVDYRSALPGTDPADLPETLWSHTYADGQAALVYRWPGDVRDAHAWAVVGPAHGLTLPHVLSLHENPNTRPAARRPPAPGWASMPTLATPAPWERTAAPGAVRTRDRRAAETTVQGEAVLVGAVASALGNPERPIRIALAPEAADLWQATQIRLLWGVHRILHDVLTPPRAIPAAGWQWSFSTYDPDLSPEGRHLAFGPPGQETDGPYADAPPPDHRRAAERLVEVLRDEGGDTLAEYLRERGVPEAPTFGDRRALLLEWLDPRPATTGPGVGVEGTGGPAAEEGTDGDETDIPPAEPLPTDDEVESAAPSRTGPRPEERAPADSPDPVDGPEPADDHGRGEEHVHADEHHRTRPYLLSRSVAGAHPSLRLNHPPEDDDGEPLPEAEDLDAPSSANGTAEQEASAGGTPTGKAPADRSSVSEAPGPESPGGEAAVRETAAPETPVHGTPRRPPGPSRVLFGERRPGSTARAEHPVFGAPEPYDPPPPPTDQAPPLNLSRTPRPEPSEPPEELQETQASQQGPESNTYDPDDLDEPGPLEPERAPARTGARRHAEEAFGGPARTTEEGTHDEDTDPEAEGESRGPDLAPHGRSPEQAPPLMVAHDASPVSDYATATEPETDPAFDDSGANWPTQYADLPLARLERWHSKRGPEGAHIDVVDARAAVRAERSELQRVRGERDHYHSEVQELRREIARLDQPFLDSHGDGDGDSGTGARRWAARLLVLVLLLAFLATGLEAGARFGVSALDMLASLLP
ncbi:hypothetical protein GCM10007147_13480 [Nocardiopsis kunsanensis]|uniref:Uncharacterized protein n=1 Tax=Nocardiopsis kunsanensis TaxID=141693 RepID=A0A919CGG1_9ACTN|nr:hypothetical protein [Nocardiopsis kunsanensis]GHD20723.1 hypothetical protein GCM10007147_13480 [Nocardiopsis kunsanensis]